MFGQPLIWGKQSKEAVHLLKWYFLILNGKLAGDPESLQSNGSWYVFCVCVCAMCHASFGDTRSWVVCGGSFSSFACGPWSRTQKRYCTRTLGFLVIPPLIRNPFKEYIKPYGVELLGWMAPFWQQFEGWQVRFFRRQLRRRRVRRPGSPCSERRQDFKNLHNLLVQHVEHPTFTIVWWKRNRMFFP